MKRYISFLLSVLMILTSVAVFAEDEITDETMGETEVLTEEIAAAEENDIYADDDNLKVSALVLGAIGEETETGAETLGKAVSRGDFLKMLVKLVTNGQYLGGESSFSDLSGDEMKNAAAYAVQAGIISDGDTFSPDDGILYEEAVKMTTAAIGYGVRAMYDGGYPNGYIKLARKLGITDNISGSVSKALTLRDAYVMIFNTLCADVYTSYFNGDSVSYISEAGENILKMVYGIVETEGIVNADAFTYLTDGTRSLGDGKIMIGTKTYDFAEFSRGYIGRNVRAFCSDDSDRIIAAIPTDNDTVCVTTDNLEDISRGTVKVTDDRDREKSYNLDVSYSLIINGVADNKTYAELKNLITDGEVTAELVDNNNDGVYEVIDLKSWNYCYVDSIDAYNGYIYDKYSKDGLIDLSGSECSYAVYRLANDNEVELADIKAGMLLSVAASADGGKIEIYVCGDEFGGTFERTDSNGKITIDGNKYRTGKYCEKNCKIVGVGQQCSVILGVNGEVVILKANTGEDNFAWIVRVGTAKNFKQPQVKYFASDGKMHVDEISDKLMIDGKRFSGDVTTVLNNAISDDRRFVKYSLDSEGKILNIDFPESDGGQVEFGENSENGNNHRISYSSGDTTLMYSDSKNFGGIFSVSSASVFIVPESENLKGDDKHYLVTDNSFFVHRSQYKIKAYNMDGCGTAPQVVCVTDSISAAIGTTLKSAVVQNVERVMNSDDEICYEITLYFNKVYYTLKNDPNINDTVETLQPGDIVRYSLNKGLGEIADIRIDYSFADDEVKAAQTTVWSGIYFTKGLVYDFNQGFIRVIADKKSFSGTVTNDDLALRAYAAANLTIVYVKMRDGEIIDVVVKPTGTEGISTYKTAGNDAAYAVMRTDYLRATNSFIYVINKD